MKKLISALFAMVLLIVVISACTDTTANDDQLYKQNIDKNKVVTPGEK